MPIPKPSIGDLPDTSHQLMQNILVLMPFVDGVGTQATDLSGNNNNGTLINGGTGIPSWQAEQGGSLQFNGGSFGGYVSFGNVSSTLFSGDFTVIFQMWVESSNSVEFMEKLNTTLDGVYFRAIDNATTSVPISMKIDGATITSVTSPHQAYRRYVFTRTGSMVSLYRDGVLESSGTSSSDGSTTAEMNLGKLQTGNLRFDGKMSDFRVYDRGFNASDVALDFSDPWAMFPPPPPFVSGCVESDQMARVLGINTMFQRR